MKKQLAASGFMIDTAFAVFSTLYRGIDKIAATFTFAYVTVNRLLTVNRLGRGDEGRDSPCYGKVKMILEKGKRSTASPPAKSGTTMVSHQGFWMNSGGSLGPGLKLGKSVLPSRIVRVRVPDVALHARYFPSVFYSRLKDYHKILFCQVKMGGETIFQSCRRARAFLTPPPFLT